MQLGSTLLCAVLALGTGLYSSAAWADDDEESNSDEGKSETESNSDEDQRAEKAERESESESAAGEGPRFEIALTTTLASYSKLAFTLEIPFVGDTDGDITNVGFGPSANPVTLEVGYLLWPQFSLGLLLEVGSTSTHTTVRGPDPLDIDETQTLGRLMVGPRVAYSFSDSGALRPFAMAAVGVTYAPQTASAGARSLALTGFEAIGGLGLHWFAIPSLSFDAAVRAGYGLGSGHVEETYPAGVDAAGMPILQTSNVPVHGSLITGSALIGVTGWL